MEIKGRCKYDYKTCRAMAHAYSYKKSNPKRAMLIHIMIALILGAADAYVIRTHESQIAHIFILVLCLLMIALELVTYFLMPRLQYNSMAKMKDMENSYVFRDEDFIAATQSEEYQGDSVIKYSLLEKVMETGEYFLIFENKRQAFLVEKSTLEGGSAQELRCKLQSVLKNFLLADFFID